MYKTKSMTVMISGDIFLDNSIKWCSCRKLQSSSLRMCLLLCCTHIAVVRILGTHIAVVERAWIIKLFTEFIKASICKCRRIWIIDGNLVAEEYSCAEFTYSNPFVSRKLQHQQSSTSSEHFVQYNQNSLTNTHRKRERARERKSCMLINFWWEAFWSFAEWRFKQTSIVFNWGKLNEIYATCNGWRSHKQTNRRRSSWKAINTNWKSHNRFTRNIQIPTSSPIDLNKLKQEACPNERQ